MERVSEELERIEREAKHIRSEALKKSEEIIFIAKKEADKLVSGLRKGAEEEAKELLNKYVEEADKQRQDAIEKCEENIKKMTLSSKKGISKAGKKIFDAVSGDLEV